MRQLGMRKSGEIGRSIVEGVTWQVSGCGTQTKDGHERGRDQEDVQPAKRRGGQDEEEEKVKDNCDPHSSWPLVGQSSINSNACSQPWHWFAVQKGCTVPSARHSGAQLLRRSKVCEFTCSPSCCVRGAHVPSSTRAHCPVVDLVGRGKRPRNKKIVACGIK